MTSSEKVGGGGEEEVEVTAAKTVQTVELVRKLGRWGTGDREPTVKDRNLALAGALLPDMVFGLVNGEVVSDMEFEVVETPDYLKIRFVTPQMSVVEIRYSEELFSVTRKLHFINAIREHQEWVKTQNERGKKKFIYSLRKERDGSGSNRGTRRKRDDITIMQLEKHYRRHRK